MSMSLAAKMLSFLFMAQAGVFWVLPSKKPLGEMVKDHGAWHAVFETETDLAQQVVPKADDAIVRYYQRPDSPLRPFLSQRAGRAPHSPRNCLPGAGCMWEDFSDEKIRVDGRAEPIEAKRPVMSKGEQKSVVYYCYQSRDRTVASEYWAKAYVVLDAIRSNRTDSALVRAIVDVRDGKVEEADKAALDFIRKSYQDVRKQLPS